MKAYLLQTDDYEVLWLDGRMVEGNHTLTTRDVLEACLGKENVESEWVQPADDYGEGWEKRVEELEARFQTVLQPSEDVRRAGVAYLNNQAEFNRAYRKLNSVSDVSSSLYRAFSDACTAQGIKVPDESKGILEQLKVELNA